MRHNDETYRRGDGMIGHKPDYDLGPRFECRVFTYPTYYRAWILDMHAVPNGGLIYRAWNSDHFPTYEEIMTKLVESRMRTDREDKIAMIMGMWEEAVEALDRQIEKSIYGYAQNA